jgi:hypothetical protein
MDPIETPGKSLIPWIQAEGQGLPSKSLLYIEQWWQRAQDAYPPNTRKAWGHDWAFFTSVCGSRGLCP